jgi:hypothetical protein
MQRRRAEFSEVEQAAFDALLQANSFYEIYVDGLFLSKTISALTAEPSASGLLSAILSVIHRHVHRTILRNAAEVHGEPLGSVARSELRVVGTMPFPDVEKDVSTGQLPRFFLHLRALLGEQILDINGGPRTPSDIDLIRADLASVGLSDAELPKHKGVDGIAWSAVFCVCARCENPQLVIRVHYAELDNIHFEASSTHARCTHCGFSELIPQAVWIQEPPFCDELDALSTLVQSQSFRVVYRPPCWRYEPGAHGVLLEARANDAIRKLRKQRRLTEVKILQVVYSADEFVGVLQLQPREDLFQAFVASTGFGLEYQHVTLQGAVQRAAAFASEHPISPRSIQFGSYYPWRHVAAAILNEALADGKRSDLIDRSYFSAQTGMALALK